ncbi:S8 family serine peptidase, partial [Candidatus Bathyarchaeota archaeon]|nr:S8 family serine peptidase [Candidatus Bathyarchaeota archaeon]
MELPSEGLYEGVEVVSDLKEWVLDQQKAAVSRLREMGIQVLEQHWLGNFIVARGAASQIAGLPDELGRVRSYPERPLTQDSLTTTAPATSYGSDDWDMTMIRADQVHDMGFYGLGTRVAILDSGIDAGHPSLSGRVLAQIDLVNGDSIAEDTDGHGTGLAGIVAKVAPSAWLLIAKTGEGGISYQIPLISGAEWAVENGADVILIASSLRPARADGSDWLSATIDGLSSLGVTVVAAVGNGGPEATSIGSPADGRNVIAVGALSQMYQILSSSSRGPTVDGRVKPDIVAPSGVSTTSLDGEYTVMEGTSAASAVVAGAMALLNQAYPGVPSEALRQIILNRAVDMSPSPDNTYGYGRLDVLYAMDGYEPIIIPSIGDEVFGGQQHTVNVMVYNTTGRRFDVISEANAAVEIIYADSSVSAHMVPAMGSGRYSQPITIKEVYGRAQFKVRIISTTLSYYTKWINVLPVKILDVTLDSQSLQPGDELTVSASLEWGEAWYSEPLNLFFRVYDV